MKNKLWYEKLSYAYNPFTIKPGFFDDEVVGYDDEIDKLVLSMQKKNMCFLEAAYGLGKTTILKYLINEYKGVHRIVHISRNRSDRAFNYDSLLKGANKGFGKLFGKKAKGVILIVDETEKINRTDCDAILENYDYGYIRSVLFMDSSFKDSRLNNSIRKEIGKNVIKLKPITATNSVELVRSRLESHDEFISDDMIKKVYDRSGKNTRQFLLNMEDVCRNAVENERMVVQAKDLKVL